MGAAEYAKIVQEGRRSEVVKDYARRAIDKWQIVIQELPPTPRYTEQAWYFTGVVYRRHLDEPEKALPYYQKVMETWPDYEYAWSAQAMLAYCYETLARSGKMTREEAEPKIEQAYRAVIEAYSDCPLAGHAYLGLGRLYFNRGQWDQAALCFGQFLERYPEARQGSLAATYLGMTYEKSGRPAVAADLYRTLLQVTDPNDPRLNRMRAALEGKKEVEQ